MFSGLPPKQQVIIKKFDNAMLYSVRVQVTILYYYVTCLYAITLYII